MSKKESEEMTAEMILAGQIASDNTSLIMGENDITRLSIISDMDPFTMSYFLNHPNPYLQKSWSKAIYARLNLAKSVEGKTLNLIIQAIGASKGAPMKTEIVKPPNVLARNIWDRDWRRRAESQGKEVAE